MVKFSPDGRVLLTIGTAGVAGNPPQALTEPCSVVTARNGDIFIAEGHAGQYPGQGPDSVGRISKFTKDGKFVKSFGRWGSAPGEFKTPHDIAMMLRDGYSSPIGETCASRFSVRTAGSLPNGSSSAVQAASTYVTT